MRGVVLGLFLCIVHLTSAQIRIIPNKKLLEVSNPQLVSSSLRFRPEMVDFGTIDEMSGNWQGRVELLNVGTDTIVITRIKSTCGCLQVDVSDRLLAPNEGSMINLKYYPRGHAGSVKQRVLIYTMLSDDSPSAVLSVQGVVTASADRSDDYPYARGVLRLRQEVVQFSGVEREVKRIACMNGGSATLRPAVDTMLLQDGLKVYFEPSVLAPKQQGDMVVEYTPKGGETSVLMPIYIKGLNLPPRQSRLDVVIAK